MSERNRRAHIGVKGRRIKRTPPPLKTRERIGEEEEEVEKELSNVEILRSMTASIYQSKYDREEKTNIKIDSNIYFLLELFDKVFLRKTYDKLVEIPLTIMDIIDDYTIKVKLEKIKYEEFYESLDKINDLIKNIKQINLWDKIESDLFKEINDEKEEKGTFTFEMYDISKDEEYEKFESLFEEYVMSQNGEVLKIHDSEYFSLYLITISNKEVVKLAETLDSISRVEREPKIFLTYDNEKLDFINTNLVQNAENPDLSNICIIDSGVNGDHSKLSQLIFDSYDFSTNSVGPCTDEYQHGSCVSGFAIYGDDPYTAANPSAKIIMLKNFDNYGNRITNTITAIKYALRTYGNNFKILNLSFGTSGPNKGSSRALDEILYKNKIVAVTSAGNIPLDDIENIIRTGRNYPDFLLDYPIFFPGDCRNIITVGGLTHITSELAPQNCPSPFSKTNPFEKVIKPDLLEKAGNIGVRGNLSTVVTDGYGVMSTSNYQSTYVERQGTSFSSPIVANYCAQMLSRLGMDNPALLKAILLSSSRHLYNSEGSLFDYKIQGFGRPSLEYSLFSHIWRTNFLLWCPILFHLCMK